MINRQLFFKNLRNSKFGKFHLLLVLYISAQCLLGCAAKSPFKDYKTGDLPIVRGTNHKLYLKATYSVDKAGFKELKARDNEGLMKQVFIEELTKSGLFSLVQDNPGGSSLSLDVRVKTSGSIPFSGGNIFSALFLPLGLRPVTSDLSMSVKAALIDVSSNKFLLNKTYAKDESVKSMQMSIGSKVRSTISGMLHNIISELILDLDASLHGELVHESFQNIPQGGVLTPQSNAGVQQQQQMQGPTIVITGREGNVSIKEYGTISIKSNPSDAAIYLDNNMIGNTPALSIKLEAKIYELKIQKKGFIILRQQIQVMPNSSLNFNMTLERE